MLLLKWVMLMKKKYIIPLIFVILFVIGLILVIVLREDKDNISTITIDINPSIELKIDENNDVVSVKALNEDGKDIIGKDLEGKQIDYVLNKIVDKVIDFGYVEENKINILMYSDGNNKEVQNMLIDEFKDKGIDCYVIVIEKISKEDEELAQKYNISPAKAAYINSISNDNIKVEDIVDKPISELKETRDTGNYCDLGYSLEEDRCIKEIERKDAINGAVCPVEYIDYNGTCYKETKAFESGNLLCRDGLELVGNDCIDKRAYKANEKCENGELLGNKCVERRIIGEAYEFCRDPGRTLYDHKCLATKPSINGGCLGKDMYYNGKCLNPYNDYYMAEWKCANGQVKTNADGSLLDNDTHCYEEVETDSVSYYCDDDSYTLVGDECSATFIEPPRRELICKEGNIKIDGDRCIIQTDIKEKVDGYYCEDESNRLVENKCIVYEIKEAKH